MFAAVPCSIPRHAHSTSSHRAWSLHTYALSPIPCRVEVLSTPWFPTRRSWPLSTPALPRRSTLARDITRSRVARLGAGFSSCTSRSLPSSDVASACCKCMFQVFQVLHMYVASVSCGCCKSRLGYCICCNGYTSILRILQAFVPNILAVSDGCCTCFIWVLHMFHT
jgi:hypothetical protein